MKVELGYSRAHALDTQQYPQPSRGDFHSSGYPMLSLLAEGPSTASEINQCIFNRTATPRSRKSTHWYCVCICNYARTVWTRARPTGLPRHQYASKPHGFWFKLLDVFQPTIQSAYWSLALPFTHCVAWPSTSLGGVNLSILSSLSRSTWRANLPKGSVLP
jgi:hypothetical protein